MRRIPTLVAVGQGISLPVRTARSVAERNTEDMSSLSRTSTAGQSSARSMPMDRASMAQKTPLSRLSEEFAQLEYSLQLCLHASTARVTNAWLICNPHLTIQYEKRCRVPII